MSQEQRPAKAARRVALTPLAPPDPPALAHAPTLSLSQSITTTLQGVAAAPVATVNNLPELAALLKQHALDAERTHDAWVCNARTTWIATLLSELTTAQRAELHKRQRKLQTLSADAFDIRWELSAEFAKAIIDLWLEEHSDLESVLAKSQAFGHDALPSGLVLDGALVKEWAAGHNVQTAELLGWVHALSAPEGSASLYRVQPGNHFTSEGDTKASLESLESELRDRIASGVGGCGALNSTLDYAEGQLEGGVGPLDDLMSKLDDLVYVADPEAIRLNTRLYLIWKLQGYCTPYHQDIHVPPHVTLYNQISGVSTFHFLPLLVGLHATAVGRRDGPPALAALLGELKARGIGQCATIGPKQMVLILPSGAHGVFVPRVPRVPSPVIRAAELFVSPVSRIYERALMPAEGPPDAWCNILEQTVDEREEEARRLRQFEAHQEALCRTMAISREDWLYYATQLQRRWDTDEAAAAATTETVEGAPENLHQQPSAFGVAELTGPARATRADRYNYCVTDADIVDGDDSL